MALRDDNWWRRERRRLQGLLIDLVLRVILAGGENGGRTLAPAFEAAIDWDTFSRDAVDFANWYLSDEALALPDGARRFGDAGAFRWATELTDSTRRSVMSEVDLWIRDGAPLPTLEARLAPLFGQERARRVAVTEVTRIYAEGNKLAWRASGVVGAMSWSTARDERVCPVCGPLHGTIVDLDAGWEFTQAMLDANPALARAVREAKTISAPPAHVMCRCWLRPVVIEAWDPAELEQKRWGADKAAPAGG